MILSGRVKVYLEDGSKKLSSQHLLEFPHRRHKIHCRFHDKQLAMLSEGIHSLVETKDLLIGEGADLRNSSQHRRNHKCTRQGHQSRASSYQNYFH
tara:strand:- start:1553 stop:1840 length:288 start_codon:yes stop_codon:yes gene_type:complete